MENLQGVKLIEAAKQEVPTMTCDQFWSLEEKDEHVTVLDVRENDEWEAGHIPWATHIPRGRLEVEVENIIPNKNEEIVICCALGGRAALAGKTLMQMGYTNVKYLSGGYTGYCSRSAEDESVTVEE